MAADSWIIYWATRAGAISFGCSSQIYYEHVVQIGAAHLGFPGQKMGRTTLTYFEIHKRNLLYENLGIFQAEQFAKWVKAHSSLGGGSHFLLLSIPYHSVVSQQ